MANGKLTDEVRNIIIDAIEAGLSNKTAAALAGIHETTFYQWIQRGEGTHPTLAPAPRYTNFSSDVKRARAIGEQKLLQRIAEESQKNWTAAAWMLERGYGWHSRHAIKFEGLDREDEKMLRRLLDEFDKHGIKASAMFNDLIAEIHEQLENA